MCKKKQYISGIQGMQIIVGLLYIALIMPLIGNTKDGKFGITDALLDCIGFDKND